ncbi:hypothetical protein ACFQHN_16515 [Natrialbaceae archaeon GCM10025896]
MSTRNFQPRTEPTTERPADRTPTTLADSERSTVESAPLTFSYRNTTALRNLIDGCNAAIVSTGSVRRGR